LKAGLKGTCTKVPRRPNKGRKKPEWVSVL
jgi:hypothetical protein